MCTFQLRKLRFLSWVLTIRIGWWLTAPSATTVITPSSWRTLTLTLLNKTMAHILTAHRPHLSRIELLLSLQSPTSWHIVKCPSTTALLRRFKRFWTPTRLEKTSWWSTTPTASVCWHVCAHDPWLRGSLGPHLEDSVEHSIDLVTGVTVTPNGLNELSSGPS